MKVKFKKLDDSAVLPSYAKELDGAMDLTATSDGKMAHSKDGTDLWYYVEYRTGLAAELPPGHVGLLFPRSSISKTALSLANSVGVLDQSFRGEICLRFRVDAGIMDQSEGYKKAPPNFYKKGDRIAQLLIVPYEVMEPEWAEELSETVRGVGGFGSTGT